MRKIITIALLVSSMSAATVYASEVPGGVLNPLWLPVTVLSTLSEITAPPPVVYQRAVSYQPARTVVYQEPRTVVVYPEPRRTVIVHEPRPYWRERHYDRDCDRYPQYRGYR